MCMYVCIYTYVYMYNYIWIEVKSKIIFIESVKSDIQQLFILTVIISTRKMIDRRMSLEVSSPWSKVDFI